MKRLLSVLLCIAILVPVMAFTALPSNAVDNNEYGNASSWATGYLDAASIMGIITERLKGSDMTVQITREEFVEVAVKFYEYVTGKTPQPANKIFSDCKNTLEKSN